MPIRLRVLALQAAYRLRLGGVLAWDEERRLRSLHAQRRRQLEAAAKRYGA